MEEKDKKLLENCKKSIIDIGGFIFLAEYNHEIVGCCSFIPYQSNQFELGKMAVSQKHQGLKIGQKLIAFAIDFAKQKEWSSIILYSSTKLPIALHIYKKHGFIEIPLEPNSPYKRSDIKMELLLNMKLL